MLEPSKVRCEETASYDATIQRIHYILDLGFTLSEP